MEAIDELSQLSDSMKQAASLLADEDPDETSSSSRRPATFLNVVALGNVVSSLNLLDSDAIFWVSISFLEVSLELSIYRLIVLYWTRELESLRFLTV